MARKKLAEVKALIKIMGDHRTLTNDEVNEWMNLSDGDCPSNLEPFDLETR